MTSFDDLEITEEGMIHAMIKAGKPGTWWLVSEKDERWNCNGKTNNLLFLRGMPKEAEKALIILKKKYGNPPDDLEWGGMKD